MKSFSILAIIFSAFVLNVCYAEQDSISDLVTPIKEMEVKEIEFDKLPKESKVGDLSDVVREPESWFDLLTDKVKSRAVLCPYAETLAYVNGYLTHIGNYAQSVIYTVLDGPSYGTQTTVTYAGVVLYVNYEYKVEYTSGGAVFFHRYSDSRVITGSTQIIKFKR